MLDILVYSFFIDYIKKSISLTILILDKKEINRMFSSFFKNFIQFSQFVSIKIQA